MDGGNPKASDRMKVVNILPWFYHCGFLKELSPALTWDPILSVVSGLALQELAPPTLWSASLAGAGSAHSTGFNLSFPFLLRLFLGL